jgi:tRNA-2-methylthio-N6-dimethylallyladenosine synthase
VEVLIEGPSKAALKHESEPSANGHTLQLTGRTMCDRIVVFEGTRRQIGRTLPITIEAANAFTLFGTILTRHIGPEVYNLSLGLNSTTALGPSK